MLIAYSAIADDPRVRRMGDYLTAQGWSVIGVGLPGARSAPPNWPVHTLDRERIPPAPVEDPPSAAARFLWRRVRGPLAWTMGALSPIVPPFRRWRAYVEDPHPRVFDILWRATVKAISDAAANVARAVATILLVPVGFLAAAGAALAGLALKPFHPRLSTMSFKAARGLANWRTGGRKLAHYGWHFLRVRRGGAAAERTYWSLNPDLGALRDVALEHGGDAVWVANDWITLPIAVAGVDARGGVMVYDSHEFATEEYAERPDWRILQRPLVQSIEARFIRRARVVTAVSPGIATALKNLYGLKAPTIAFRNMPAYAPMPLRATKRPIRVLYHGAVAPERGLEAAIYSVAQWREEFELTIRGPSHVYRYIEGLQNRINAMGLQHRVTLAPPVPTTELVRTAAEHDIGFFALPAHSLHNEYALPNKVFEYMMAGLALCVSDLEEMQRVVADTGAGVLIRGAEPDAIAAAINALTPEKIDAYKRAALEAAKRLHWDVDAERAAALYAAAYAEAR